MSFAKPLELAFVTELQVFYFLTQTAPVLRSHSPGEIRNMLLRIFPLTGEISDCLLEEESIPYLHNRPELCD